MAHADTALPVVEKRTSTMVLTFHPENFTLEIGGQIENFNEALAMLAQATRLFEHQAKMALVQQTAAEMNAAALTQRINSELKRKGS